MAVGSSGGSSNISFSILRNTDKAQKSLSDSFQKLSSGLRINKAADDAAGLAIAESLSASIVSLGQASRNVGDFTSLTEITDGALNQIGNLSARQAELATQSANGTLSDQQRESLNLEYQELSSEIQRIAATTEFNGIKVFEASSITAQVGTDASAGSQLSVPGVNISSLISNISSQDIGTQAGAQSAITAVQSFTDTVSQRRGEIGAAQSRLSSVGNTIEDRKLNEAQALSRIRDLDVAEEVANQTRATILTQAGPSLLAQASKLNAANVKALLG